jgi:Co/Zn/Cd efflux system component
MVTLHATIKAGADSDQCIRDIARELEQHFNVRHATIQIERQNCVPVESCELHATRTTQAHP